MAVPINKEELQNAIKTNYKKFNQELSSISKEQALIKNMEGHSKGTMMSVNNLLAYLVGWGNLVLKWNYKKDNNETVDFPETGFKWNELGKLAQSFYEKYDEDFPTLLKQLDSTVSEILDLIESKSNKDLYEVPWYNQWTLGRMIQFNTSSPFANARSRIRKWKKEQKMI